MFKKLLVPIITVVLVIAFFALYFGAFFFVPEFPLSLKILFGVLLIGSSGVSIYVLVQRIKEIRSGEEDDLSKY